MNEVGLSKESFKDTDVKEQIISSPSNSGLSRTVAGTEDISNFMIKIPSSPSPTDSMTLDDTLVEFLDNENDDLFANFDV